MEFEGRAKIDYQPDITPLIDIVFLLLIFFMLTSTMMIQEGLEVNLPGSSSSGSVEKTPLLLVIDKDGSTELNGEKLPIEEVQAKLKEIFSAKPQETIIVKADSSVPVQDLVNGMDAIRNAGGVNISLATSSKAN